MRRIVCDRLATLLSMTTTTQSAESNGKSKAGNHHHRGYSDGNQGAENSPSNSGALTSILDLLETRIAIDDEDRQNSDKTAKTRRDWMLAAAVIDRLCFIALLIVFIGGTLIFLILFLRS